MIFFPQHLRVTSHTEYVGSGSTFVAIRGLKEEGNTYIGEALKKGATRIVIEEGALLSADIEASIHEYGATLMSVPSARKALAELAAEAYGYPSKELTIIGITGTKGKSTTVHLIEHMLRSAGHSTALIGTIHNKILDAIYPAPLTTPQPDYLHAFFALCREQGVTHVVMEAAAQALSVHRLDTILFDTVVFTNFSLEHSEFYPSMDEYFLAKTHLFSLLSPDGLVILNADDERVSSCLPDWPRRCTVSMHGTATYAGTLIESTLSSLVVKVEREDETFTLSSPTLIGEFSAYNLLMASAVVEQYGLMPSDIQGALTTFEGVPGRTCRYTLPNGAIAVIDNAHTPSSFEAVFSALRPLSKRIIAIFGAGGDRDALKRPLMGAIAEEYADEIFLTTDNPRSEEALDIVNQIQAGMSGRTSVTIELDREQAIRKAYALSNEGTVLMLLGKGPVEYQHIKDQKIPFSEVAILRSLRSE